MTVKQAEATLAAARESAILASQELGDGQP